MLVQPVPPPATVIMPDREGAKVVVFPAAVMVSADVSPFAVLVEVASVTVGPLWVWPLGPIDVNVPPPPLMPSDEVETYSQLPSASESRNFGCGKAGDIADRDVGKLRDRSGYFAIVHAVAVCRDLGIGEGGRSARGDRRDEHAQIIDLVRELGLGDVICGKRCRLGDVRIAVGCKRNR